MSSPRIVIVDDDQETRSAALVALAPLGADVHAEDNAARAYHRLTEYGADLVLLSADLPGGLATCDRIKGSEFLRRTPVVILTTDAARPALMLHRQSETRADAYVVKPLEPAEVLKTVRAAMKACARQSSEGPAPAGIPAAPEPIDVDLLERSAEIDLLDDLLNLEDIEDLEERAAHGLAPSSDDLAPSSDDLAPSSDDLDLSSDDLDLSSDDLDLSSDDLEVEADEFSPGEDLPPPPPPLPDDVEDESQIRAAAHADRMPAWIRQSAPAGPVAGAEVEELRSQLRELSGTLVDLQSQFEQSMEASSTLRERIDALTRERDDIQGQYEEARDEREGLRREIDTAQAELRRARAERDAILGELKRAKTDAERLTGELEAARENTEGAQEIRQELDAARRELAERAEEAERVAVDHALAQQEIEQSQADLVQERDDLRAERDQLTAARDRLTAELARAEAATAALRRQVESLAEGDAGFGEGEEERTGELPDIEARVKQLQAALESSQAERERLAGDLEAERARVAAELRAEFEAELEAERAQRAEAIEAARRASDDERAALALQLERAQEETERLSAAVQEAEARADRQTGTVSGERRALLGELEAVLEDRDRLREELESVRSGAARADDASGGVAAYGESDAEFARLERELEAALEDRDRLREALEHSAYLDEEAGRDSERVERLERELRDAIEDRDRLAEALREVGATSSGSGVMVARSEAAPDASLAGDRFAAVAARTREALDKANSGVRTQRQTTAEDLEVWARLERDVGMAVQDLLKLGHGAGTRDAAHVQGLNQVLAKLHELLQQGSGILQRRKALEDSLERLLDQVSAAWRQTEPATNDRGAIVLAADSDGGREPF